MDLVSALAGAGAATTLIGTGLIPYLRLRSEHRASLRQEAAEERSRRLKAEDEVDSLNDYLDDALESAEKFEKALIEARIRCAALEAENSALRSGLVLQTIVARLVAEPGGEIAKVMNSYRDLTLVTKPIDGGTVIMALGPWERIGIDKSRLLGSGWRSFVAPESREKATRVEESALAAGGRAALWYRTGKGDFCLSWTYGRYNGETLAVARVIAFRNRGPETR